MGAWGSLHSWLASCSTKRIFREYFGKTIDRYYRLMFIGIAVLTFLPILAMIIFLPSQLLWRIQPPWLYLTIGLQLLAVVCILVTIFDTDVMAFVGIKQVIQPDVVHENELVIKGFYKIVRHPMYFFTIVLIWFIPYMTVLVLTWVIASTLYFVIGSIFEEKKMLHTFGESYAQYQKEVARIIPGLKGPQK
jgi:protein-S-isoprenylcysteine O-methyltransferase Ste14